MQRLRHSEGALTGLCPQLRVKRVPLTASATVWPATLQWMLTFRIIHQFWPTFLYTFRKQNFALHHDRANNRHIAVQFVVINVWLIEFAEKYHKKLLHINSMRINRTEITTISIITIYVYNNVLAPPTSGSYLRTTKIEMAEIEM